MDTTPFRAPHAPARITFLLFLVAASGLIFEITVTRLFSFFFQYHYAFLAISLAVLGLSLGAAVSRFGGAQMKQVKPLTLLSIGLLGLALSFPLIVIGMARLPWTESIWPRALLALLPFLLIGWWTALAFTHFTAASGSLYAADLAGAGVGVIGALALLTIWSPFSVTLFLGVMLALAATLFVWANARAWRWRALGVLCIVGGVWMSNLATGWLDALPTHTANAPRDKTMLAVLNDPTQAARLVRTVWSPFARADLVETNDPAAKFIFADGGAGSTMVHFDGLQLDTLNYLRDAPEFIPFAVSPVTQTLILGAGAGKDIVMGLLAGAQQITAVEVNPATAQITRDESDYNGHILHNPDVNLVVSDARTYVERSTQPASLIYLNLVYTQAAAPASQALAENYTFTRQAFRTYLEHLTPNGHLAIVSHNALEGSRAAVTALQALSDLGIPPARALDHLVLSMLIADDPTLRTSVLLVGREPLNQTTIAAYVAAIQQQHMQPLFIPGLFETAFAPLRQGASLRDFVVADADYELGPTDDDKPFFFKLDPGLPPAIGQALVIAAGLALGLLLLGLRQTAQAESGAGWRALLYMALLGLGFMLVEVPLIQHFQLLLGYPVLSLATVLGALLLAGGLGSWLSQRWPEPDLLLRIWVTALCVSATVVIYWVVLTPIVQLLLPTPLTIRVLATIILTALPGVAMGIPFPSLLRLFKANQAGIAYLWSVNGACSVLGSTLAVAIAMTWGFGLAMLGGAVMYGALAVLVWGRRVNHK
ncbi:MAG: class I SAM-dependent methyltransferase [Chloroflexi bacterium]|nr:class I SAM-dependent methyltransferase [Chloroflexota bacterium]